MEGSQPIKLSKECTPFKTRWSYAERDTEACGRTSNIALPVRLYWSVEQSGEARLPRDQLLEAQLKKRPKHSGRSEELEDGRVHGEGAEARRNFGEDVDLVRNFSLAYLQLFPFYHLAAFHAPLKNSRSTGKQGFIMTAVSGLTTHVSPRSRDRGR